MRNTLLSIIILAFSMISRGQQTAKESNTISKFQPSWGAGLCYNYEYPNKIIGIRSSYNIDLFSNRTSSMVMEPAVTFGLYNFSDRYGIKAIVITNLSILYRQKLGPFSIGLGPSFALSSISPFSSYKGFLGLSGRLGYIMTDKLLLEVHGNLYADIYFEYGSASIGLNLVRLSGDD